MKTVTQKIASLLYCILQAAVGVLLLIDPVGFTAGIIMAIGALLVVAGFIGVIKYFRTPVDEAARGQLLTKALLTVLLGVFAVLGRGWLIMTFPVITILYGVIMLVIGVSKIQLIADAVRRKEKKWIWGVISALITLACAGVVIMNPFSSTAALWMFTGISIIVDAVFDLVAILSREALTAIPPRPKGMEPTHEA